MMEIIENNKGFTLFEIIVTLMLVGILAAITGMGIGWSMQGYTTARENVAIAQKAQLALLRTHKELSALSEIKLDTSGDGSTSTCIIYKVATQSPDYRILRYNSSTDELEYLSSAACTTCACPSATGHTLADNLGSVTFSYYESSGTEIPPGTSNHTASDVGSIKVTLVFNRADTSSSHTFNITISPRNNGNLNAPGFAS